MTKSKFDFVFFKITDTKTYYIDRKEKSRMKDLSKITNKMAVILFV